MTTSSDRVGAVELLLGEERPVARIRLAARQNGVPVVRQFIAGMSEALRLERQDADNLKLAVTEACTNAVLHAYEREGDGPIEVELRPDGGHVHLLVRDFGSGPPRLEQEGEDVGYGLSLIQTVCDELELGATEGGGTELRMRFDGVTRTGADPLDAINSPVLHRVVAVMAASAGFSMDRLSDAVLVAETLAAHTPNHSVDGSMSVAVEDGSSDVILRVGPLRQGGGDGLLAETTLPAFGGVLEHLADEVGVERGGDEHEFLVVRLDTRA